ncbi:MAG: aminopeptidase [Nitrososphaerota archaeon]|nr:aminopeptidase [Nitrososphaerota archaeon]MDG6921726.1 aminopeptidase [Nitrososphaerota archaeon]
MAVTGMENVRLFVIENLSQRPLKELPKEIDESIPWANVTFWAAQSLPGELPARHRFIDRAKKFARHGHMPNITSQLMEQGMRSNYDEVYTLTHKIYDIVKDARIIEVKSGLGSDLCVEFDKNWRWVASDGKYHSKGRWGNLPEGEVFTAPMNVNGILVTNLLGDWFSEKYGNFEDSLRLEIRNSVIQLASIQCKNEKLTADLSKYLSTDINSPRASEFAMPTNPLLISLPTVGNLLQDEKARVHIAFGDPYRDETGAPWEAKTHVDMLLEACDVKVEGRIIMNNGKYII